MKLIMLALAGYVVVRFVGTVGAVLVEAWWSDRVHAPDPELDEVLDPYQMAWREW